jgi:hypothetical protein
MHEYAYLCIVTHIPEYVWGVFSTNFQFMRYLFVDYETRLIPDQILFLIVLSLFSDLILIIVVICIKYLTIVICIRFSI